jgi:hypothetical protein
MSEKWTCYICGAWLTDKYHIDGNDYCPKCARSIPRSRIPGPFDEEVRGTIIGAVTTRYQFWRDDHKLTETDAEDDGAAIEWFKTNHPEQFKLGAEMRAFDV